MIFCEKSRELATLPTYTGKNGTISITVHRNNKNSKRPLNDFLHKQTITQRIYNTSARSLIPQFSVLIGAIQINYRSKNLRGQLKCEICDGE